MRLVVDSSVAIKWLITEAESDLAVPLRRYGLLAPDLIATEITSILWKKVRIGQIARPLADEAVLIFQDLDIALHSTADLMAQALDLAYSLDHSPYDMFFVTLALREGVFLVTADLRLIRTIRNKRPRWADQIIPLAEFQPG